MSVADTSKAGYVPGCDEVDLLRLDEPPAVRRPATWRAGTSVGIARRARCVDISPEHHR